MPENKNHNEAPPEFPSRQQKIQTEPIVDVVENEIFPPKNAEVQQIISKSQQE